MGWRFDVYGSLIKGMQTEKFPCCKKCMASTGWRWELKVPIEPEESDLQIFVPFSLDQLLAPGVEGSTVSIVGTEADIWDSIQIPTRAF